MVKEIAVVIGMKRIWYSGGVGMNMQMSNGSTIFQTEGTFEAVVKTRKSRKLSRDNLRLLSLLPI